jgi:hypothetical protein
MMTDTTTPAAFSDHDAVRVLNDMQKNVNKLSWGALGTSESFTHRYGYSKCRTLLLANHIITGAPSSLWTKSTCSRNGL